MSALARLVPTKVYRIQRSKWLRLFPVRFLARRCAQKLMRTVPGLAQDVHDRETTLVIEIDGKGFRVRNKHGEVATW